MFHSFNASEAMVKDRPAIVRKEARVIKGVQFKKRLRGSEGTIKTQMADHGGVVSWVLSHRAPRLERKMASVKVQRANVDC